MSTRTNEKRKVKIQLQIPVSALVRRSIVLKYHTEPLGDNFSIVLIAHTSLSWSSLRPNSTKPDYSTRSSSCLFCSVEPSLTHTCSLYPRSCGNQHPMALNLTSESVLRYFKGPMCVRISQSAVVDDQPLEDRSSRLGP